MAQKKQKHTAPPRYDTAFRDGAVKMVTEQGHQSREVARELGICIETLRNWLKSAGAPTQGEADRQSRELRKICELEAEVRELRKKRSDKDEVTTS